MGLTFEQSFYQVDDVYMLTNDEGTPIAIFEVPYDDTERNHLVSKLRDKYCDHHLYLLEFDDLIRKGLKIEKKL